MSIVGTRPEIIKMSEIVKKLDKYTDHIFIHTGQNYDYELNEIFYKDLDLRHPDHVLQTAGDSLAETVGNILFEVEKMLDLYEPDAVVILGDTNSALSGIIAKRKKIPLFHLEAGNRCFDDNVPEEINRRILDHISDVNMVYNEGQRAYLRDEGIAKDRIFVMGSPMKEVLSKQELTYTDNPYYLVSIHRDENTEIPENLNILIDTLGELAKRAPVLVSTHPRLRSKIDGLAIPHVTFHKPFGFKEYLNLQRNAICVISDSGTIAEEASILGFPAITIRNAHERAEATDYGSILMSGVDKKSILSCLDIVRPSATIPPGYEVDNCSDRVLNVIIGYTPYVNKYVWHKQ
jgi:UDP-N-acetylglucosamine 2-epimerase (non-hydrolysing)